MNIGIFGGTFDPIHNGHLFVARSLLDRLDNILFLVTYQPPHKEQAKVTAFMRYEMTALALQDDPHFFACDYEIKKGEVCYTVDTMRELKKRYPKDTLWFITGADMFLTLPYWKDGDALLRENRFIAVDRDNAFADNPEVARIASMTQADIVNIKTPAISSTQIRNLVANGEDIGDLVPKAVENYIKERGIYERCGRIE